MPPFFFESVRPFLIRLLEKGPTIILPPLPSGLFLITWELSYVVHKLRYVQDMLSTTLFIPAAQHTLETAWSCSIQGAIGHYPLFQALSNILLYIPISMLSLLFNIKCQQLPICLIHMPVIHISLPQIYSNSLSSNLEIVRPDWVLSHYARWTINEDHAVVLILSWVCCIFLLYHFWLTLIPGLKMLGAKTSIWSLASFYRLS